MKQPSRRTFLQTVAAAGVASVVGNRIYLPVDGTVRAYEPLG